MVWLNNKRLIEHSKAETVWLQVYKWINRNLWFDIWNNWLMLGHSLYEKGLSTIKSVSKNRIVLFFTPNLSIEIFTIPKHSSDCRRTKQKRSIWHRRVSVRLREPLECYIHCAGILNSGKLLFESRNEVSLHFIWNIPHYTTLWMVVWNP